MPCTVDIVRLACALAQALGYKAAPLVQAELPEALLEQVPDLEPARIISSLSNLSQFLEGELGDVSGTGQGSQRSQCAPVN